MSGARPATAGLHVEHSGTGPPLALWHGWGLNLRVFDALRAQLEPAWRTIAVDLPGHGASAWPTSLARDAGHATIDGEQAAEGMVDALLESLPPATTLVGWSLGGQLALRAALRAPGRIARLVLIATTPRFVRAADWPHGVDAVLLAQMSARLAQDYHGTLRDFLELQVRGSREATAVRAALSAALRVHGEAQPAALAAGLAMLAATDLRDRLARITTPTLVIAGEYDRVTPPGAGAALAAALPNARFLSVARAGHAPFLSHLALLLPELRAAGMPA